MPGHRPESPPTEAEAGSKRDGQREEARHQVNVSTHHLESDASYQAVGKGRYSVKVRRDQPYTVAGGGGRL